LVDEKYAKDILIAAEEEIKYITKKKQKSNRLKR
jgi:hypothetical protein